MSTALPTDAASARFAVDGAVVLRGAVPDTLLARARAAVDDLAGTAELADLSDLAGDTDAARFRAGVDHWRRRPEFVTLAAAAPVPELVAGILRSERLWLYEDSVLVKEPGTSVATRWHTDDGYFHVEGRQLATVWLPLDPAPRAAGALRFVKGSHLASTRFHPTLFVTDDPIPGTEGSAPPAEVDPDLVIGWDLEPGDLTIHHARTLHAAGGNSTRTTRRALSIRYCGDDAVVAVKAGAPAKPGFAAVGAGTAMTDAAPLLGLPCVWGG